MCLIIYLSHFFLEWEMFQTAVVEEIKTHILHSVTSFIENHAVYEIMWKNIVQPGRPQMTVRRMHIALYITKVTNTHSEYVILGAYPLQQRLHERASLLGYVYIGCLGLFFERYLAFDVQVTVHRHKFL